MRWKFPRRAEGYLKSITYAEMTRSLQPLGISHGVRLDKDQGLVSVALRHVQTPDRISFGPDKGNIFLGLDHVLTLICQIQRISSRSSSVITRSGTGDLMFAVYGVSTARHDHHDTDSTVALSRTKPAGLDPHNHYHRCWPSSSITEGWAGGVCWCQVLDREQVYCLM